MISKAIVVSGDARKGPPSPKGGIAALLIGPVALLVACGGPGGSATPGYVSGTPVSSLAFTQCMRTHGVRNFPYPPANGVWNLAGINQNSPQFRQAAGACGASGPGTGPGTGPGQEYQGMAEGLALSRCMRAHGVFNYPDPTVSNGNFVVQVQGGTGTGIDPSSPVFQAAKRACRSMLPNGGTSR